MRIREERERESKDSRGREVRTQEEARIVNGGMKGMRVNGRTIQGAA